MAKPKNTPTDFIENNEETSFDSINEQGSFNPITSEPVITNTNRKTIPIAQQTITAPLPEATDDMPPNIIDDEDAIINGTTPADKKERKPFNEEYNELNDDDKEKSAEQLAEVAIGIYEYLVSFPPKIVQVNQKKLTKLHNDGVININIPVPFDAQGNTISVENYIQQFNAECEKAGIVSDDFKQKVYPLLVKIFKKNGFGLTDEQTLGFLVAQDLVQRTIMLFQLGIQARGIIDHLKEINQTLKQNKATTVAEQPTAPTPEPPKYRTEPEEMNQNVTLEDGNATVINSTQSTTTPPETVQVIVVPEKKKRGRKPKNVEAN